jgi:long-chain fatty acid transport protein
MRRQFALVLFLNTALCMPALAAGYGLKEHSAAAMGAAYAGSAASLGDASFMAYNPAALAGVTDTDFAVSVVEIIPHSDATYTTATTAAGTPASGSKTPTNFIADAPIPAFSLRHRLTDDVAVGLSVSAPYGLKTTYPTTWAGRYYAVKTQAITVNIAPSLAWQVTPELALGAALNVEYARGVLTSAIDVGTLGLLNAIPGSVPGAFDGFARISAISWETGFSLGGIWQPASDLSVGLSYQSAIHHNLEGPLTFTLDPAGLGAAIRGATGLFNNTRGAAKFVTPDMILFGVRKQLDDDITLMFELDWTNWSRFKNLTILAQNPAQPPDVTTANWESSLFVSLGGEIRLDDAFKLRGGVGYDESPVPDATRSPRIPDASRTWLAAGLEYRLSPGTAVNLSYGHLFNDDSPVALSNTQPGNALRGVLAGTTRSSVDVLGLQISSRL